MASLERPPEDGSPVGGTKAATAGATAAAAAAAAASPTAVNGADPLPPLRLSRTGAEEGTSPSGSRLLVRLRSSTPSRPPSRCPADVPADAERSVGCFGRLSSAAPGLSSLGSAAVAEDPRIACGFVRSNAALLTIFSHEYKETRQWSSWGPDAGHLPAFTLWAAWYGTCGGGRWVVLL